MAERIIILGASARAAAFSALRAGFVPWTADLFADADLAARCPTRRVENYPAGLERAASAAPAGPWMYTGGLENHPGLVDRIAAVRPLWGVSGNTLREVRDPWAVRGALLAAGLPSPALRADSHRLPPGNWLCKPRRSAGGAHIRRATPSVDSVGKWTGSDCYFQQEIAGKAASGVFVAAAGRACLLGVTRQLTGTAWTGAREFQYAGSVGPLAPRAEQRQQWRQIGDCLAQRFGLVGLFGVDAICNQDGVFPVEVNPRYTASVEVLEQAGGFSALAWHAAACQTGELPDEPENGWSRVCGKAILYARHSGPGPAAFWAVVRQSAEGRLWPFAADLPHEGEAFQAGRPVLTVLADGANVRETMRHLRARARRVFDLLEG